MNGRDRRRAPTKPRPGAPRNDAVRVLGEDDATLLDLVDNALSKGVVLTGDLTIGLAQVDLVHLRLSLLLCAADRLMPGESHDPIVRRRERRVRARNRTGRG
jgi:hypothetical protein